MKNLENYGVQAMNAKEIRETDGGSWGLTALILAVVIGFVEAVDTVYDAGVEIGKEIGEAIKK